MLAVVTMTYKGCVQKCNTFAMLRHGSLLLLVFILKQREPAQNLPSHFAFLNAALISAATMFREYMTVEMLTSFLPSPSITLVLYLCATFCGDWFVCLFVLRFYGPVNPMGSCRARSVYLTTRLLGRLSPLSGWPVLCTFFRQKLTTALLESAEGREWP